MTSRSRPVAILATLLTLGAFVFVGLHLLRLCGGPIGTADAWWHLKMGEVYATEGPWPEREPLLHTAHEDAPVQHEWAFDVALHGIDRTSGLAGVRVVHVLAVAGILALVFARFRREGGDLAGAGLASVVFVVLAWWRLIQLRPDLVSIPATLLYFRLLLEDDRPPSWPRVAASVLLIVVWVNAHSLFAIGPLLVVAALLGLALRAALRSVAGGRCAAGHEAAHARRLGAALALGGVASLLNPRGFAQHVTFFTSSREAAIWAISDEWTHFDPFDSSGYGDAVSLPAWITADAVIGLFGVTALVALVRFVRRPSDERLAASDPVLFGLGLAAVVATLVSVRFLWMLVFPLLFLLRFRRLALGSRSAPALSVVIAAAALALAAVFPHVEGFRARTARLPADLAGYLSTSYDGEKFYEDAVRFLEQAGLAGNLFNVYPMGGFLEYRVGPRLRTFVDGRTEHYPAEVLQDYFAITAMQGVRPGESFLGVLERRDVDVFVGIGAPTPAAGKRYTSAHLEGAPGWVLVSRSMRHGIYVRDDPRNRENLRRVAEWYAREGIPFDLERGLDVDAVIRAEPGWAERHGMVPRGYGVMLGNAQAVDSRRRRRALEGLGRAYALVGAYERAVEANRAALALAPRARAPRRRLVYALLRLGRAEEAEREAQALHALDPADAVSARFLETARQVRLWHEAATTPDADAPQQSPQALVNRLPVV